MQPYWEDIEDNLADGIQFVENHAELTESTEGSPQRPAKKRPRFSRVLDTHIRISVSPSPPARPAHPPPPAVVDDWQFESVSHPPSTPAAPVSPLSTPAPVSPLSTPAAPVSHPPHQLIQVILTTST